VTEYRQFCGPLCPTARGSKHSISLSTAPADTILVLTSLDGEDIAKLAVQRGAQDYLLKARLDSYLLPKALDCMIGRAANAEALFAEKERAQVTLNASATPS